MGPNVDRSGHVRRIKPITAWEAFGTAAFCVVYVAFTAALFIAFFFRTEPRFWCFGCVPLLMVYAGVRGILYAVRGGKARSVFEEASTATEATVLGRKIGLIIQFDAGREQMTLKADVSYELYNATEDGGTLTIRYANVDPRIALLEGEW